MHPICLSITQKKVHAIWINRSLDIYRSMQPYMDVSKTGMLNPLKCFTLTELMSWSDTVEWYFGFYIIEINVKMQPIGAKLFAKSGINLILKIKLQIEAIPINPKQPRAIKDDGTWTYIILTESPWI